jgi:hypothetical protein
MKEKRVEKAGITLRRAMGLASQNKALSVKAGIHIWEAMVRTQIEYGSHIWCDEKWEAAEKMQREMGKRILCCSKRTTNEVVMGELGWI